MVTPLRNRLTFERAFQLSYCYFNYRVLGAGPDIYSADDIGQAENDAVIEGDDLVQVNGNQENEENEENEEENEEEKDPELIPNRCD